MNTRSVYQIRLMFNRLLISMLILLVALSNAPVKSVYAATITVTNTADDLTSGNGCSLREAIINANNDAATYPDCPAGTGADTITLSSGSTYILSLIATDATGGDLDVFDADGLTIQASGTTPAIIDANDIDRVLHVTAGNLNLNYITITNGTSTQGGGVNFSSSGNLTINNSAISNNVATNTGLCGGGVFSASTTTVNIINSAIFGNQCNSAGADGGGIIKLFGILNITNSTIYNNFTNNNGGGIRIRLGTANISFSTFSNNSTANGATNLGGAVSSDSSTTSIVSSILANSTAGGTQNDCDQSGTGGVIISNSIVEVNSDCGGIIYSNSDPGLGTFQNNGGPTNTMAIANSSVAFDAATSCGSLTTDQRGISRPQGSACDIGAFELENAPPTVSINQAASQSDPTNSSPINFTVVFSEPVTGFATGDVTLAGTAGATTATVTEIAPNDGTTYNVAVSGMTGDGTVIATIAADVAINASAIGNEASTSTDNTVTYNTTGPTVMIDQAVAQADPTNLSPINFTVVFSESVTGFATGDVTLAGTAGATTAIVTEIAPNDGTTFNVVVSGMTGNGTVIATISGGVAFDAANNGNVASTSTDNTVNYDIDFPVVTSSVPANNATIFPGPTQLTVNYSEDVKNDGSAGAANNTVNYLLVEEGPNAAFDTISCLGGPLADDVQITTNSATYTNSGGSGPFVATLNINGGSPLPTGTYHLLVCGTTSIEDLIDNELNDGLSDTTIEFAVVQQQTNQPSSLPDTGFPKNEVTKLLPQPVDKTYTMTDLWLEIPKFDVKMPIVGVPKSDNGWDVAWLDKKAGWLNGSAFPTWSGNSVITGHVWDTLNRPGPFTQLKNLQYGDQIKIHAFGQIYTYEIRESKTILPTSISTVFKHEEKSWITLITCENYVELAQQYSRRRMVRAVLVHITPE